MNNTSIEWTDKTWNPVVGCSKISPGCKNCYAERMSKWLAGRYGYPADEPFKVMLHPDKLEEPLKWRKPQMIFVSSMGDLFHEDVPDDYIDRVFAVMALCPQHIFQILTKRPKRMYQYMADTERFENIKEQVAFNAWWWDACSAAEMLGGKWEEPQYDEEGRMELDGYFDGISFPWPLPNVWLGTTIEDQQRADERMHWLLQTPAAVRLVSVEPMLSAIHLANAAPCPDCDGSGWIGMTSDKRKKITCETCYGDEDSVGNGIDHQRLDWVICGCESGPKRRSADIEWIRSLRDQCTDANVPFLLKQMEVDGKLVKMPELDGKVWQEMPDIG